MNLQESIEEAIRNWPTLYECRTDVLRHFFCAPDNNMVWQGGTLVDPYGPPTGSEINAMFADKDIIASLMNFIQENIHDIPTASSYATQLMQIRRKDVETRFRIDNASYLAFVKKPIKELIVISETAKINSIPSDIQPDWLDGIMEIIPMLYPSVGMDVTNAIRKLKLG